VTPVVKTVYNRNFNVNNNETSDVNFSDSNNATAMPSIENTKQIQNEQNVIKYPFIIAPNAVNMAEDYLNSELILHNQNHIFMYAR
jgi:hypothetical protein